MSEVVIVTGSSSGIGRAVAERFAAGGGRVPYAVSKAALHHLTRTMAQALAPDVRVNAVAPGLE